MPFSVENLPIRQERIAGLEHGDVGDFVEVGTRTGHRLVARDLMQAPRSADTFQLDGIEMQHDINALQSWQRGRRIQIQYLGTEPEPFHFNFFTLDDYGRVNAMSASRLRQDRESVWTAAGWRSHDILVPGTPLQFDNEYSGPYGPSRELDRILLLNKAVVPA